MPSPHLRMSDDEDNIMAEMAREKRLDAAFLRHGQWAFQAAAYTRPLISSTY